MLVYTTKRYRRFWLRFVHLLIAGIVGWVLSSQWLHGQDWVTEPASQCSPALPQTWAGDQVLAGQVFWQSPHVASLATDTTFRITKQPFRYGDFGATSYPQRYQTSNYYRSRTDWIWQ
jgi:4-amino-4-deoxy-L-arabinose transferase-like glycosyltransferase